MINRVILKKKWKHQYKNEPYPVGTILQPDNGLRAFLLDNNIAKEYKGEYPPKKKQNIKLEQLK
jgi:hypothetical protein